MPGAVLRLDANERLTGPDPHPLRTPQTGCEFRVASLELLGDGFGRVVAQVFQFHVVRLSHQVGESLHLFRCQKELDE
jgi:hypothetical protein